MGRAGQKRADRNREEQSRSEQRRLFCLLIKAAPIYPQRSIRSDARNETSSVVVESAVPVSLEQLLCVGNAHTHRRMCIHAEKHDCVYHCRITEPFDHCTRRRAGQQQYTVRDSVPPPPPDTLLACTQSRLCVHRLVDMSKLELFRTLSLSLPPRIGRAISRPFV